jgi:hypothetical protein
VLLMAIGREYASTILVANLYQRSNICQPCIPVASDATKIQSSYLGDVQRDSSDIRGARSVGAQRIRSGGA